VCLLFCSMLLNRSCIFGSTTSLLKYLEPNLSYTTSFSSNNNQEGKANSPLLGAPAVQLWHFLGSTVQLSRS